MTRVYADASSAILLEKAGLFEPLAEIFRLVLAGSVFDEITLPGYAGAPVFAAAKQHKKIRVQSPMPGRLHDASLDTLDRGEKETLCLFLEGRGGFILMDDKKAILWCLKNHHPFINALLVPKLFWYGGWMTKDACKNKMDTLCHVGRYSEKVKAFAFDCTPDDLSFFAPGPGHAG